MAQNGCKMTIVFILCWPSTDGPGPALKCGFYPVKPRCEKADLCKQMLTAHSCFIREERACTAHGGYLCAQSPSERSQHNSVTQFTNQLRDIVKRANQ